MKNFGSLIIGFYVFFVMGSNIAHAVCQPCGGDAAADGRWVQPDPCPTWCCSGDLSYPVSQTLCEPGVVDCTNGAGYVCNVGGFGCIHGTYGCDAPCGC